MDIDTALKVCFFTPGLYGRWGLPLVFKGEPGTAKTAKIEAFCKEHGLACMALVGSIKEPTDFGGMPIPQKMGKQIVMRYAPPSWCIDLDIEGDGRGVCFLDELTTVPPATQAAMLKLVLEGAAGEYKLSRGIRFVAACNDAKDAAGGWELAPPTANRFGHMNYEGPTVDQWADWYTGASHQDFDDLEVDGNGALSLPAKTAADPVIEERRVMKLWPNSFAAAKGKVISFLRVRPDLKHSFPVEASKQSGPWPSVRTWDMATRSLAGASIQNADEITRDELFAGFIGRAAASEFLVFQKNLDLPLPADVLDGKVQFVHEPKRLDRTVAVLNSCAALVGQPKCDKLVPRAIKLWEILSGLIDDCADLCVRPARTLIKVRKSFGSKAARDVLYRINPVLTQAGVKPR